MHWVKKTVYGMLLTLFVFIALIFLEIGGQNPFDPWFVGVGGLMLLLGMGLFETNLVTL